MQKTPLIVLVSLLIVPCAVQADSITLFTDRAAFNAAAGALIVENFTDQEHLDIFTGRLNSETNLPEIGLVPGMIKPGVTYSTPISSERYFFNIDLDYDGYFSGGFLDRFFPGDKLTISFDGPQGAFGFDTNKLMGSEFSIVINFLSGSPFASTLDVNDAYSMQFFGFTSRQADISSVVIGGNGFSFALDNFVFGAGQDAAVPEPVSLVLFGAGLAALGLARTRKRR